MKPFLLPVIFIVSVGSLFTNCRKKQERLPLVTTSVCSAGWHEARCSGVLYFDGDAKVTEKGICWGIKEDLSVDDNKVICESDEETFTGDVAGLDLDTKYYARAYAINEFGISYGQVISFRTLTVDMPQISMSALPYVTINSAEVSVQLTQLKASSFTTGICWSKIAMPTIQNSTLQISVRNSYDAVPQSTVYGVTVNNLDESTTYYARAFATNSLGIVYSNQVTWTTVTPTQPIVTFSVQSVGFSSAVCDVEVDNQGGFQINSTGICWSEGSMPTTAGSKLEQSQIASTPFNIENLNANTFYYIRAYVVTDKKTYYSAIQRMVLTYKDVVTDIDGNEYYTIEIGGQEWMASNLRASSFNDGTPMPNVINYNQWANNSNNYVPMYCYYGDNSVYNSTYGKLYPRYVAHSANLAPAGWHVATIDDWQNVFNVVNSISDLCINNGAWGQSMDLTNLYNFSLYPAGYRENGYGGSGTASRFWALPGSSSNNAVTFESYNLKTITWLPQYEGLSVRCVKD
jgi:uncharacterized protein (TIGR02145 family)